MERVHRQIGSAARRFVRRACPDRISSHQHSPVSPDQRQVLRKTDGTLLYSVIDIDGERRTILPEDMLHFAGLGFDGVRSMSVIQWAARQAIGNSLAAADYAGRSFADGTLPQIAIRSRTSSRRRRATIFATRLRQPTTGRADASSRLFWPKVRTSKSYR